MSATKSAASMVSIYSGNTCIGFVLSRGPAGFEAFDVSEQSIGTFVTEREAVAAVMEGKRP
jgi:hypothetical protein